MPASSTSTPETTGPPNRFAVGAVLWLVAFVALFFSFYLPNHAQYRRFDLLISLPEMLLYNLPDDPVPVEEVHSLTDRMLGALPSDAKTENRVLYLMQQMQEPAAGGARYDLLAWWHKERLQDYQSAAAPLPGGRTAEQAAWDDVVGIMLGGPPSGWKYFPQRFSFIAIAAFVLAAAWGLGRFLLWLLRFPPELGRLERFVLAAGLGLSGVSLFTLLLGLAGLLHQAWFFSAFATMFLCGAAVTLREFLSRRRSEVLNPIGADGPKAPRWLPTACVLAAIPFLLAMSLGAMLPSIDFDVKEYHLQGPKEFFLQGRVTMLPHNVYTSFPFLTEMLSLAGMVLHGDWYWGALAGKLILMAFAPLTALAVLAAGRRWFGPVAGWLGFLIHLSTPWTYRISVIAYAEGGLTFYLFATLLAVMLAIERQRAHGGAAKLYFLAGLLAGSAMACKYPGVLQVVIPLGLVAVATAWRTQRRTDPRLGSPLRIAFAFALGTALTVGPWLAKNLVETGNPVYPLLYSVFGGRDWNSELNAKWKPAHSPSHHRPGDLAEKFVDVTLRSDWLSPLLFALAPLALCWRRARPRAGGCWLYVGFLFLSWWGLTHRIDRFWIPLIPVVSLLAGIGCAWTASHAWQFSLAAVMALVITFNLGFVTTALCGYNQYLIDLAYARESTGAPIAVLNRGILPETARVLCVGEAQVFDARFPLVYNTVFDVCIFEEWCGADGWTGSHADRPLRDAEAIRRTLKDHGITHVFVNWQEILRYRVPGSYGYTDFVTPSRFTSLQQHGVLGPAIDLPNGLADFESRPPAERQAIADWAPELIVPAGNTRALTALQLFPVAD